MKWPKATDHKLALTRRQILNSGLVLGCAAAFPGRLLADSGNPVDSGLATSDLIYLTPLQSGGQESRCQAEIWFVSDNVNVYVVTAKDAWRAKAVRKGLKQARIWVGDLGNWQSAKGRYRALPMFEAVGNQINDPNEHRRVLELFGSKYRMEWLVWGPRFRTGLNDGSRVMLQYTPA